MAKRIASAYIHGRFFIKIKSLIRARLPFCEEFKFNHNIYLFSYFGKYTNFFSI